MKLVLWMWFALHVANALFSCLALCGLEKKICISYVFYGLLIFDAIVLVWSQVVYFQAQRYNCQMEMADVYFWLMGEILFFYILTAFIVCYFFRRFCQDPLLKKKIEEEERENEGDDDATDDEISKPKMKDMKLPKKIGSDS